MLGDNEVQTYGSLILDPHQL